MKFSNTFIPTLRNEPSQAEVISHVLLLRAGFIRQLGSGLFTWLPLGVRVLQKIEKIVREELNRHDACEVLMPFVQPGSLWKESHRWKDMGPEMLRLVDRHENDYCLSPTHEEVVTDLFRNNINSYRQLPCNFYQIGLKFRDEIRPRFGALRSREFIMKDGYSFHLDQQSLNETYLKMHTAYSSILSRLDLDFRAVEADPGVIGDGESHEFHVLANSGEDELAYSQTSDYAANLETAEAVAIGKLQSPTQEVAKLHTPEIRTIASLVDLLNIPVEKTVKTLIVRGKDSLIALILRGDHELNVLKAGKLPETLQPLEFASEDEIVQAIGCNTGSIGPVRLNIPCFVDRSAATLSDFFCGANENDYHLSGVNWGRDVVLNNVVDIRNVKAGDEAADGSGPLSTRRGIEVGHIFKLGTKYSKSMGAAVLNAEGQSIHPWMGCYGIGITRLAAAVVEQCHSEKGIEWPIEIAPARVHLVALNNQRSTSVQAAANQLYETLTNANIDTLYDDRDERPGVKFGDADLIGVPYRVTVGERSLQEGMVEFRRCGDEDQKVPIGDLLSHFREVS